MPSSENPKAKEEIDELVAAFREELSSKERLATAILVGVRDKKHPQVRSRGGCMKSGSWYCTQQGPVQLLPRRCRSGIGLGSSIVSRG
jgi:hypothetical protein